MACVSSSQLGSKQKFKQDKRSLSKVGEWNIFNILIMAFNMGIFGSWSSC